MKIMEAKMNINNRQNVEEISETARRKPGESSRGQNEVAKGENESKENSNGESVWQWPSIIWLTRKAAKAASK
jgi:hypothetical protein